MRMRIVIVCVWLIYAAFLAGAAYAEDERVDSSMHNRYSHMSLEELMTVKVVSTGFFETELHRTIGAAHIITDQQIQRLPAIHLADVLDMAAPAVYMGNSMANGPLYGTRGVLIDNNAKTQALFNGQNINQRAHFGYWAGFKLPLLGDILRIEVINGPGAIAHGSGAINGIVNCIPRNGSESPGARISLSYGARDRLMKAESDFGIRFSDSSDLYVYGGVAYGEGHRVQEDFGYFSDAFILTSGLPARHLAHANQWGAMVNAYPRLNGKITLHWRNKDFRLTGVAQSVRHSNNSFSYITTANSYMEQTMVAVNPVYTAAISGKESLELSLPVEVFDYEQHSEGLSRQIVLDINDGASGTESHMKTKAVVRTARIPRNNLAIGASGSIRHFGRGNSFSDDPDPLFQINGAGSWLEAGLFVEDVYRIIDPLSISAGLRYDAVMHEGLTFVVHDARNAQPVIYDVKPEDAAAFVKRAAVSFEPHDWHSINASYQEGFRYPDVYYYRDWHDASEELVQKGYRPFDQLEPEYLRSLELNYTAQPGERFRLTADVYYNRLEKMLHLHTYNIDDEGILIEEGAISDGLVPWLGAYDNTPGFFGSVGGELCAMVEPASGSRISLSYGYSRPHLMALQDTGLGITNDERTEWSRYPAHLAKATVMQSLWNERVTVTVNSLYASPIDTDLPPQFAERYGQEDVYASHRFLLHGSVIAAITERVSAKLSCKNITGQRVPPITYVRNKLTQFSSPWYGNLGVDERLFYAELRYAF